MTIYGDEEQVWKCARHSSKRRRCIGVCPFCLTERLSALCPDCANSIPCFCSASSTTTSSSSTSAASTTSSFSLSSISTLMDNEPPFLRRSAFPFFRSARFSSALPPPEKLSSSSIWSAFFGRKSRKEKMTRSKSVASVAERIDFPATGKWKGWYFPSPMKVFRHSKSSKVAHQKSPLYRG